MIKVSVWCRRGAFLAAAAMCCGGFVGTLPGANQHAGVDGSAATCLDGVLSKSVSCRRGAFFIIKMSVSPRRGAFDERLV